MYISNGQRHWRIYAFLLGFSAILLQTILFRNIFAHLGYSEISYITTLFLWLCLGALGSFSKIDIAPQWALFIFAISGILTPVLVRVMTIAIHPFFGSSAQWWEILIITGASSSSAFWGGLTFGTLTKSENTALLYALEGLGAFSSGIVTILTINFIPIEWIAIIVSALIAADFPTISGRIYRGTIAMVASAVLFLTYPVLGKQVWSGFKSDEFESHYGKIVVLSRENENFIYRNGRQIATASDTLSAEILVHPIMWAHKNPRNVLVMGGEQKGALKDILKHNPQKVVIPVEDKILLKLCVELIPSLRHALSHDAVQVRFGDIRKILSSCGDEKFDVILLMPGLPENGADNRFWTIEFMRTVWDALSDSGISAIALPVGANLLSTQQAELASSVDTTIKLAWQNPQVWFFENTVVWIAQKGNPSFDLAQTLLKGKNREIATTTFSQEYLPILLQPERTTTLIRQLSSSKTKSPNTDTKPYAYSWGIIQSAYFSGIFLNSLKNVAYLMFILLICSIASVILLSILKGNFPYGGIFCSGIWGIVSQSVFVLTLQSWYGNLYLIVGTASGTFLLGSSMGSLYGTRHKWKIPLSVSVCLLILILWVLVIPAKPIWALFVTMFLSGSIGGLIFGAGTSVSKSGANLYSADLTGAAFGTILAIIVLPTVSMPVVVSGLAVSVFIVQLFALRSRQSL